MTRANRKFSPPAWATLGLICACAAFVSAGFWQLDRGDQKRRLFSEFDSGTSAGLIETLVDEADTEQHRYRPFRVAGRYDTERQFLLDNMIYNGRPGYQVLTPLLRDGAAVLINRGWLPADADRTVLPDIAVETAARTVTGLLAPLPRPGIRLEVAVPTDDTPWPRRQSYPTIDAIRAQLGYAVPDYQLLLKPGADDGFVRDWRPAVMSPEKHLSYAVQWFGFAITLCIIFVVVNWK